MVQPEMLYLSRKEKNQTPKTVLISGRSKLLWIDLKNVVVFLNSALHCFLKKWAPYGTGNFTDDFYCIFLDIFAHASAFLWQKPKYDRPIYILMDYLNYIRFSLIYLERVHNSPVNYANTCLREVGFWSNVTQVTSKSPEIDHFQFIPL